MAGPDEKDLDAAERALGTEPRAGEDAEAQRARRDWDATLAPLGLAAPPAEPPADMFQRIARGLDGDADAAKIVQLAERRARRWRAVALATSGIAACLLAIVAAGLVGLYNQFGNTALVPPTAPQRSYVALMTPQGGGPVMTVGISYGEDRQDFPDIAFINPYDVVVPEGQALELWKVPPGGGPESLGLIDLENRMHVINVALVPGDTLAVSVEPPGGSPTGAPTGDVILSGPVIQTR